MQDELKEETIVNKVGGRFKLSTLIQKRLVALHREVLVAEGNRVVGRWTVAARDRVLTV